MLYDIFSNITDLGLQITNSRISTTLGAAIDSLYIVDQQGRKITNPETIDQLYQAIESAMHVEQVIEG